MKAQSWLWPDHVIGKRESRKLREEHNALYNSHADLLAALKRAEPIVAEVESEDTDASADLSVIRAAIAKAEGRT